MIVIPTFHLAGRCQEAIELYKKAFYLDVDWQGVDEKTNLVYHTEARIGNQRIRLSDGNMKQEKLQTDSLFLAMVFDAVEEVERAFHIFYSIK